MQNFLGARWTSGRIVSDKVQDQFGKTIDVALERGLQPVRNLFGTRGGRGNSGPTLKKVSLATGGAIDLEPGARPRLREPRVSVRHLPKGESEIRIELGTADQLKWALALLRKKLPHVTIEADSIRHLARSVNSPVGGPVELVVSVGGSEYFRGMLKSCFNLLGVSHPALALDSCFDPVRDFILNGQGDMEGFVRWILDPEPLQIPRLGPTDQFIGIITRGQSVEGVVQFFGDIVHSFRLSNLYSGKALHVGYLVDPHREANPAEDRHPEFAADAVPLFDDQSRKSTPEGWKAFEARLRRIAAKFFELARDKAVDEVFAEVLDQHKGEKLTREIAARLARRLAERLGSNIP